MGTSATAVRQSLDLHVGGRRLEAAWWGPLPDAAPTLVLLHEGLGCVDMWRDLPGKLAAATGYGVLVYSRLGYGRSDPCPLPRPLTYMHDEALEVLPALLATARVRDCVLVGHSDGGSIALVYAGGTKAPPLRGVVTLAGHVFCEELSVTSIAAAKDAYEHDGLRERLARYHGSNVDCAFWGWNRAWLEPEFMRWNLESYLPDIDVPVLAVQGIDDEYGTGAQVDAIVAGAGAESLLLENCGHSPQRDREQATIEAVAGFVRRLAAAAA